MRRQTISVFCVDGVAKVFAAVATLLLIRLLPVAEYAKLTVAMAGVALAAQTTSSSVNQIYILASQRDALPAHRGPLLGLQVLMALLICGSLLVAFSVQWLVVLAAVILAMAFVASDFVRTEYQRKLSFRTYAAIELLRNALFVFLILLVVLLKSVRLDAAAAIGLQALALAVVSVPLLIRLDLIGGIASVKRGAMLVKSLLSAQYLYLFGYYIGLALFSQLGIFMLKQLGSTASLAAYGSGFRYYTFLLVALAAALAVLLPSVAGIGSKDELRELYRKHLTLLLLFIPAVLVADLAAPWFIPWVDAGRYPEAVPIFWVLATSAIISFACSPYVLVVMRFMRMRFLLTLVLVTIFVNAALNAALIPAYGGLGAAIATLISYAVLNGATFFKSRRLLRDPREELHELSPLMAGLK